MIEEIFINFFLFIKKYFAFGDLGLTIIILAFLIKIVFFPLEKKSLQNQKQLISFQKKINEIKEKYKQDYNLQQKELLNFLKKEKINPFSSFFSLLIQIPFLILIFKIIKKEALLNNGYLFLNFFDLSNPSPFFAFLAASLQFFQQKSEGLISFQKFNYYLTPFISLLIFSTLPSALVLYILSSFSLSFLLKIWLKKKN